MQGFKIHFAFLLIAAAIVWSAVGVHDTYLTWILESAPALAGLAVLVGTYKNLKFSTALYAVFTLHIIVLLVGAHYSYANVPLGFWMEDGFGFTRNNYDKIGRFMQGVTPALIMVELLRRTTPLKANGWIGFISVCVAEAVSVVYEIIEWLDSLPIRRLSLEHRGIFGIRRRTCSCAFWGPCLPFS